MEDKPEDVLIDLSHISEGLLLFINAKKNKTLFDVTDAVDNNEARYQLVEGCYYDFEFSSDDFYFEKDQIVQPHSRKRHIGTISPNIFVGTLSLPVFKNNSEMGKVELEVQSVKAGYRNDYRDMLKLITEKCTDLLMQVNSPVFHYFEIDYSKSNETLYQKFAFIKSILATDEFAESVHRIISSPVTCWEEIIEFKNIRKIKSFRNSNIKEFVSGRNRTSLPDKHYLRSCGLQSIPEKITSIRKIDSVDTAENRFIKYALEVFLKFCSDINKASKEETKLFRESDVLIHELESYLHHSVFKEISRPDTLKINSPILQRKESYREVLRVWLMFDLAAKLIWKGGEDVYSAGKKDIAVLYEYWLFFKLLELFQNIFEIEPKDISDLIQPTTDGLNLKIKQGNHTALRGVYNSGNRKLNIRFNYNRSFSGLKNYPQSGSWTNTMRPDYTLSFWTYGVSEKEAENQELIVHIHFDAKYKVANLRNVINEVANQNNQIELGIISKFSLTNFSWKYIYDLLIYKGYAKGKNKDSFALLSFFWEEADIESIGEITGKNYTELIEVIQQAILSEEKEENKKGIYKNADLLKMHAYKDAIRRTGGAYVLYPGETSVKKKGFHEIIPGLGAFPVRPSAEDSGIEELKIFIYEVIDHFINRASQREKLAYRVYDIHKNTKPNELREAIPEAYGENRSLIPDDTFVLVGYYNSEEQYKWIKENKLYNFRMGSRRGSLPLNMETVTAKYLLLHTKGVSLSGNIWRITGNGIKVYSQQDMINKGYKFKNDSENYYLIIEIDSINEPEFKGVSWNFKKLKKFVHGHASAIPFTASLTELMKTKVK
jgi:predicted component of viral defense system (DUF524 family)